MGLFGSSSARQVRSPDEAALAALPRPTAPPARNLPELAATGRYLTFDKPNGGVVHVIGVVPGAKLSEDEVALLLDVVKPDSIYLDLVHEQIAELQASIAATSDGRPTTPGPEWPKLAWTSAKGFDIAMEERTAQAGIEMLLLCGADFWGPWRAALKWQRSHAGAPPTLLSYPFPWEGRYKDGRAPCKRVVRTAVDVIGTQDLTQSTMNTVAVNVHPPLPQPLLALQLALPPDGGFTRPQVQVLRKHVQQALSAAAQGATGASMDGEELLARAAELEKMKLDKGTDGSILVLESLLQLMELNRTQSRAVAYSLKSAAGQNTVAVVDLARLNSYQREWDNDLAPEQLFPPRGPADLVVRAGLIGGPLALFGWATHRAFKRFPKSTGVALGLTALMAAGQWWQVNSMEFLTAGSLVRGSLSRPLAPMGAGMVHSSQLASGNDVVKCMQVSVSSGATAADAAAHAAALAAAPFSDGSSSGSEEAKADTV